MNNLIKFNLDEYHTGKYQVVTSAAEENVKIIAIELSLKQPVVGVVRGDVETWFLDGSYFSNKESVMDINLKPIEENELVK